MLITTMTYDELLDKIEEYLPVRKDEKEKFGEVFTPPILINELLDQLPNHVWTDPTLKWLDPASGTGNFFMLVFFRLMTGLAKKIPNKNKRSHHILKNMLYMVDINSNNVKIARTIFGINSNITCADFLSDQSASIHKFDIIIGNLPFNEETNENNKKTVALWSKFVIKSLEILNTNGYLAFIHPPNWRSPDNKNNLWDILTHKYMLYLHIYGPEATKEFFHVNTKVDLYIVQNKQITKNQKTPVIDELGEKHQIYLPDLPFLPNYKINEIADLLDKNGNNNDTDKNNLKIIYDTMYSTSHTNEIKKNTFKFPVISSITNGNKIHLRYSDCTNKGHFDIPKVIINGGRYPYPYNDYKGKYGMTQNLFAIPITSKKQGDDIVKAINSEEFISILKATKWNTFAIDYKLFKHFKSDFYKRFLHNSVSKKSKKTRKMHSHY
jgi:hypothetical protein